MLVHGGAGAVPPEKRERHREGCVAAAEAAAACLARGGSALDAVEIATRALEDDPVFNAGRGGCLNEDGAVELDAAIMDGRTLRAGAVCAIEGFAAPIAIARKVLEDGRHVLYAAGGAAAFARAAGFEPVAPGELVTEAATLALARVRAGVAPSAWAGGTVGAVARDATGATAAATSTGGIIAKRRGRVGDSPILGAGTYADDEGGAVSATGAGESILRLGVGFAVVDRLRLGAPPDAACREVLARLSHRLDATAGVIAVSKAGRLGWARTTGTMSYAATWSESGGVVSGV